MNYLWYRTLQMVFWNTILKLPSHFPHDSLSRLWSPLAFLYFYFPASIYVLNVGIHQRSILVFFLMFFYWNFHSCSGFQLLYWCGLQKYFSLNSFPVCWTSLHVCLTNLNVHWNQNSSLWPNTHLGEKKGKIQAAPVPIVSLSVNDINLFPVTRTDR